MCIAVANSKKSCTSTFKYRKRKWKKSLKKELRFSPRFLRFYSVHTFLNQCAASSTVAHHAILTRFSSITISNVRALCGYFFPVVSIHWKSHQRLIYYDYMYNTSNQLQIASIINCRCLFPSFLSFVYTLHISIFIWCSTQVAVAVAATSTVAVYSGTAHITAERTAPNA